MLLICFLLYLGFGWWGFFCCRCLFFFLVGVVVFLTEQPYSCMEKKKSVEFCSVFLELLYKLITPFLHITSKMN